MICTCVAYSRVAINDPVMNTDQELKDQLQKVIENPTKPELVDLGKFPWLQDTRPYSVFMFVVDGQETASHKGVF